MSYYKAKIQQIRLAPDPADGFQGLLSRGERGTEGRGKEERGHSTV